MRIVACDAGLPWIMHRWQYLRETGGPRRIVTVAERTIGALARRGQGHLGRVFYMGRSRTVARLAGHTGMLRFGFAGDNIVVTVGAGLMSGIGQLVRCIVDHRLGPIMTVLAERIRDQKVPDKTEADEADDEQRA